MTTIGAGYTGFAYVLDVAHHLILPVVTLAILYIAQYSRMERASMIDILGTDYIRTARAKGLRERTVVYKHALKNALIPVVTLAGMQFSQVFAGAVLEEAVIHWTVHPAQGLSHAARHPLLLRVRGHHRQRPDRLRLPVS